MGERPILFSSDTPSTMRSTQPPNPEDKEEGQTKSKVGTCAKERSMYATKRVRGEQKEKIKRWPAEGGL